MKIIDLSGPDGNSFALLATAKKFAKQLDLDYKEIEREMIRGDYDDLLTAFKKYFGDYVELINEDSVE